MTNSMKEYLSFFSTNRRKYFITFFSNTSNVFQITNITLSSMGGSYQSGVVYGRAHGWYADDFVADFTAANPLAAIAARADDNQVFHCASTPASAARSRTVRAAFSSSAETLRP